MPGKTPNEMTALDSSHMLGARYDRQSQKLVIEFRQGGTHEYTGVTSETADAFFNADSHGEFFHRQIKGRYAHKQT